jgi:predicted membrane protein
MENKSTDKKLIIGIILMIAGGLLLLDTFNISNLPISHYIFSWKTLLIAIGLVLLATKERAITGYILIGLGIIFWLPSLINYSISLGQVFWPAILIGIGVLIITKRGSGKHKFHDKLSSGKYAGSNDYLEDVSILGGGTKIIQSNNFKGGDITAIFGGSEFSFKDAEISPEGCTIDVFTLFGGSKLVIPDSWVVKSDMFSIFGGFNDKRAVRPEETEYAKVLHLKGAVIFGGIEIKSF